MINDRRSYRNDILTGFGGKQILLDDPAGNPMNYSSIQAIMKKQQKGVINK
ncbi:hypothetical protein P4H39_18575 [Paenibacillus lautus]|uniref:hypothetical protein n=1 Tax=Paenibacillus lautus TaxID=1401 RepID=UPI002DBD727A|nr:hypothetical protein [Paenibacillus lautus]MEC0204612.1 hypothetical protein [Paenibacillus lautus]